MSEMAKVAYLNRNDDGTPKVDEGCYLFVNEEGELFKIPCGSIDVNSSEPVQASLQEGDNEVNISLHMRQEAVLEYDGDAACDENRGKGKWSESATKLLLALYSEYKALVEGRKIPTFKKMWGQISLKMLENGYSFSPVQAENRWKTLERAFKRSINNNKKTGRSRQTCSFETELADMLVKRSNIFPPLVLGTGDEVTKQDQLDKAGFVSSGVCSPSASSASTSFTDHPPVEPNCAGSSRSTTRTLQKQRTTVLNEIRLLRAEAAERHAAKEKAKQAFNERYLAQFEERNKELKRKNDLFQQLVELNKK